MDTRRVLLIAGPTAGGKSAVALALAERHGGVVINADSMAVYRDLRILSGRPTPADETRAPHRLYGHQDAATTYSVGQWLAEVGPVIQAARADGKWAIVVGGTGLYLKGLSQGLSDIPPVPEALRDRLRAETGRLPAPELHARLAARDPLTAARLRPTDPQRILRALEVFEATGRPLASYQDSRKPPIVAAEDWLGLVVDPLRDTLRQAIDHRFDRMMHDGALSEVEGLLARRLDPALPAMRALGVPPLIDHLIGNMSLDEAVARAKAQTRAYAKRQVTFARHQLTEFSWMSPADALDHPWLDQASPASRIRP